MWICRCSSRNRGQSRGPMRFTILRATAPPPIWIGAMARTEGETHVPGARCRRLGALYGV